MKKFELNLLTSLFTFFLISNINAQSIDSLAIIPVNPTTSDTVRVISYSTLPWSSCPLVNSSVNINNDTISIYAFHGVGMLPAICNSIDTITIGILNAGVYELNYYLDTTQLSAFDIDTITFTVQQTVGLKTNNPSNNMIKVYPNPATTHINVDLRNRAANSYNIDLFSVFGQKIKTLNIVRNEMPLIDLRDLNDGVYFMVITDRYTMSFTNKIIKTSSRHH